MTAANPAPTFHDLLLGSVEPKISHRERGLERFASYILFYSQLIFPSTYLKALFVYLFRVNPRAFASAYVLFKLGFSFCVLYFGWYTSTAIFILLILSITETVLYNLLKIVCQSLFDKPPSYKRVLILGVFNYLEIVLNYASIFMRERFVVSSSCDTSITLGRLDHIYFSMGTGGALGFGDYSVQSSWGKLTCITECLVFLMFFILFVSYNLTMFSNPSSTSEIQRETTA